MNPAATAIPAPAGPSPAYQELWITVWQARYRDGDAGRLPSPLRREVPLRIHHASLPKALTSPVRARVPHGALASPRLSDNSRRLQRFGCSTADIDQGWCCSA
jgi:hypothetical protein